MWSDASSDAYVYIPDAGARGKRRQQEALRRRRPPASCAWGVEDEPARTHTDVSGFRISDLPAEIRHMIYGDMVGEFSRQYRQYRRFVPRGFVMQALLRLSQVSREALAYFRANVQLRLTHDVLAAAALEPRHRAAVAQFARLDIIHPIILTPGERAALLANYTALADAILASAAGTGSGKAVCWDVASLTLTSPKGFNDAPFMEHVAREVRRLVRADGVRVLIYSSDSRGLSEEILVDTGIALQLDWAAPRCRPQVRSLLAVLDAAGFDTARLRGLPCNVPALAVLRESGGRAGGGGGGQASPRRSIRRRDDGLMP